MRRPECHVMSLSLYFFFNDTATTEIYTLSLHDALPIWPFSIKRFEPHAARDLPYRVFESSSPQKNRSELPHIDRLVQDRKSTRLNSSHPSISYAVFCLKKKKHIGAMRAGGVVVGRNPRR